MNEFLNHFVKCIPSSPTLAMSEQANQLTKQGIDVINLSVGEPDLPVPEWVRNAATEAIIRGEHVYTPIAGLPELRQAVVDKLVRENHLSGYQPSQVIVGNGAKQVLFNACMVLFQSGNEVIVPAPYWVSYPTMVEMSGATPVMVGCPEQDGFKLSPERLRAHMGPNTRGIFLNSPSNPTGAVYTPTEWRDLADVLLERSDIFIICDDIYEHLVYAPYHFTTLLEIEPALKDRTLVVNGLSKSFSMTGWRVGYGVGPASIISGMTRLQSHSTSGASCITQWAAIQALNDPKSQDFLQQRRKIFQKRRDLLVQGLQDIMPVESPAGAFYVYANILDLMKQKGVQSDLDLGQAMLKHAHVSGVPGTEFGLPGYMRFSYATSEDRLHRATQRLQHWARSSKAC
jgi:aspartate aminotransferase